MKTLFKTETTPKSRIVASLADIEEFMIAMPGIGIEDAREMVVDRMAREERIAVNAANVTTSEDVRFMRESIVFPKAEKRISSSDADHKVRLSAAAKDSDAMTAFLAKGGEIKVLSTRNAKGFVKSRTRVSGGAPRTDKSRIAHNAHDRNLRALNAH
tara:strand:+ start:49 stop:519 length:471 start_codon:yes stop_codon:yes gene_type:complete